MATSCGSACVIGSDMGETNTGKNKVVVVVCVGTKTVVVVVELVVEVGS